MSRLIEFILKVTGIRDWRERRAAAAAAIMRLREAQRPASIYPHVGWGGDLMALDGRVALAEPLEGPSISRIIDGMSVARWLRTSNDRWEWHR